MAGGSFLIILMTSSLAPAAGGELSASAGELSASAVGVLGPARSLKTDCGGQYLHAWLWARSAFGRIKTCLRRAKRSENPPAEGNNTGASRLTEEASRPDKQLAYGEQSFPPAEGNKTGASCPDKQLAYGEQNFRPSAELEPD